MKFMTLITVAALSAWAFAPPVEAGGRRGGWGESGAVEAAAPLTDAEAATLRYMHEEEKVARDVYREFFDRWEDPMFEHIARSEQRHMDAMKRLLDAHGVADPVTDDSRGAFEDKTLAVLYRRLTDEGAVSLEAALQAGAYLEELDILDLERDIAATTHPDLARAYENLLRGSRNHLRAFVRRLESMGIVYQAQVLEPEVLDGIVDSPMERGGPGRPRSVGGSRM